MDLKQVGENAKIEFHKARVKEHKSDNRFGLHVTSMLPSKCLRQVYYEQHDDNPRLDSETVAVFHAGKLEHSHSHIAELAEHHEIGMAYDPFTDKAIDLKAALKAHPDTKNDPFWFDIIIGSTDDIIIDKKNNGEVTITDKKTKLTSKGKEKYNSSSPKPAHREQINYYALLLNRCKGITAKYGCIIELDFSDRLSKANTQPFELDNLDHTRAEMIHVMGTYKEFALKRNLPPRISGSDMDWLCFGGYCPWYTKCFDGDGIL